MLQLSTPCKLRSNFFFFFSLRIDATKYTGSVHHQVNSNLAAAAQVQWTSGTSNTALTVAGKYTIDSDTFVKVSIC